MSQGRSSLNPYAEAYIPISKRDSSQPEENHWKGNSQDHGQTVLSAQNQYSSLSSYGGPYHNVNDVAEEQTMNEQFDMDLDYLKTRFPSFAVDSIIDVFMCNNGDLDSACEMLAHLEHQEDQSLPETLDIGDVSESSPCASLKLKNVPVATESSSDPAGSSQVVP